MKYYKVVKAYDNAPRFKWGTGRNTGKAIRDGFLIAGELYTERERSRLANHKYHFEEIETSKNKIYCFFGARFADETPGKNTRSLYKESHN